MAAHSVKTIQHIPVSLQEAWDFFSNPQNLSAITPARLSFSIVSRHHGAMIYPGQIIEYKVAPVAGVRLYWMTEITHVQPMKLFVDEQRLGPYALWHHEHHFRETDGGVEMTDIIHYKNPFGFLGRWMNPVLVKPELKKIFRFRFQKVEELFGIPRCGSVVHIEMA
jgi:ligand-binding SRPBCC domain-containing protein